MIRLILMLVVLLVAGWHTAAFAQDGSPQITRGQLEPTVPTITAEDMLSSKVAGEMFKQCRSFYPRRFTPNALTSYCDCTMATTPITLTGKEYAELQNKRNQKASNPTYQKYIVGIVAPCMSEPTVDIEYMTCVLERYGDSRVINNLPRYCQCVAQDMRKYVNDFGDTDILITMTTNPKVTDPMEALWMSRNYMKASRDAKNNCIGQYTKTPMTYSYN